MSGEKTMDFYPGYDLYRQILQDLIESDKLCSFHEAQSREAFVVLRHDIEFSVERAFAMSQVESKMGVCSTYFVQIANNAYNAFSGQNASMLRDMRARGHEIGLHFHIGKSRDPEFVREEIAAQCEMLEKMLEVPIRSYSMHRPATETRYYATEIPGLINAYAPAFFSFKEAVDDSTQLEVKYIADSQHRWNYGYPDAEMLRSYPKIQLLIHPDFWSEKGLDKKDNFSLLIQEHAKSFSDTIDSECKHYHDVKIEVEAQLF